jgi:carbamoyl-phosphate synthase small subunit
MANALLVLEDGATFVGESIGAKGVTAGPMFFDTRVVAYQEVITDPANAGKILSLTYPLIGNYGVNDKFKESARAWINGLVIKELSKMYSSWQAKGSLDDFLKLEGLVAMAEADTRTLTVHLRDKGEMWAAISTNGRGKEELLKEISIRRQQVNKSSIKDISVKEIKAIKGKIKARVGILDLGVLQSLTTQLNTLCLEIVVLPYNTPPGEILKLKLNGLIVSSGPEEDAALDAVVATIQNIIGKLPLLGIALGSQLIARAVGAKVKKMRLGHHGVNYPIEYVSFFPPSSRLKDDKRRLGHGKGDITVQNHSWVVDVESLKKIKDIRITALHLNDATLEAFASGKYKIIAVQYYPQSPGFGEVHSILINFLQLMKGKN